MSFTNQLYVTNWHRVFNLLQQLLSDCVVWTMIQGRRILYTQHLCFWVQQVLRRYSGYSCRRESICMAYPIVPTLLGASQKTLTGLTSKATQSAKGMWISSKLPLILFPPNKKHFLEQAPLDHCTISNPPIKVHGRPDTCTVFEQPHRLWIWVGIGK